MTSSHRVFRPFAALLPLLAAAACSDLVSPPAELPAEVGPALGSVQCVAQVAARSVSCSTAPAGGARFDRVLGGQNVLLKLTSSRVSYDTASQVFAFDMTLQNLMVQRMGTDGVIATGSRVFFHALPTATAGSGEVEVLNQAGTGLFTGSDQPYFDYGGTLGYQETSAPQRWELGVPRSVTSFGFTLYVSTRLLPVILFDKSVSGNRDIYRMGIDGSDLVRLTTHLSDDRDATVAGNQVVFTSYRHGNADLFSMPLAGGTEVRLTSTSLNETDPALTADGSRLAFSRAPSGGMTRVFSARMDSLGAPALVTGSRPDAPIESTPSWTTGNRLALMSTEHGGADIWQVTLGGAPSLVTGMEDVAEVEPAWSPDGTRIAFATNRLGDTEIFVYELATDSATRLTTRIGSDGSPAWLKDGRIVYTCTGLGLCILDPAVPGVFSVLPTGLGTPVRAAGVLF